MAISLLGGSGDQVLDKLSPKRAERRENHRETLMLLMTAQASGEDRHGWHGRMVDDVVLY